MKKNVRKQGILLPISSIPSAYGIGTFGKESYRFVDFLEKSGNHLWQILPLGPTGYGDSPYQSFSTFAGNPYYIDLELLIEDGYLTKEICDSYDFGDNEHYVDYEKIYLSRFKVLKIAFDNAREQGLTETGDYQKFLTENAYWLDDYALYMAVKNAFGGVCFMEWDEDIRLRKAAALRKYRKKLAEEIAFYCFQQYLFAKQWKELKAYANKKGIEIVGDIPIYVAFDSADTWANPKLFQLDKEGRPIGVAGCPPDCFSETGQLWGNPLYDWSYHKKTGYAWWMQRIAYCYQLYDVLRIDHFRGFDEYWFVPYGDPTAENGHWEKGPGYELFDVMKKKLGRKKVIAEDLGFLTPSVIRLVKKTGYPGRTIMTRTVWSIPEPTITILRWGSYRICRRKTRNLQRNIWDIRMTRSFALRSSGQHCPAVRIPQSFPCRIIWSWTAAPGSTRPPLWDATGNGVWIRMHWIQSWRRRFIKWQNYMQEYKNTEGDKPSVF